MRARIKGALPAAWPEISIGQLAALLVAGTALPLLVLAVYMYSTMLGSARQTARDTLMSHARTLGALAENEIDTYMAIAKTLATADTLQRGDLAAFRERARRTLELLPGASLNLIGRDGAVILSTRSGLEVPPAVSAPSSDVFTTRRPQLTDLMALPGADRPAAFAEVPVLRNGEVVYVLSIALDPARFLTLIQDKFGSAPAVAIIDRQHRFVARIPDHERRYGTPAAASWQAVIALAPEGVYETVTLEGAPSFTAYVTTRYGWIAGISFPKQVVDAPASRLLWSTLLVGFVALTASFALGSALSRQLTTVVGELAAAARRVGSGETVHVPPQRILEADVIGSALSAAARELASRTELQRRAHDTFLNLVLNAPFGVYLVDSRLRIAQVSAGARNVFASVEPVLGRDLAEVLRALWPEPFASETLDRFRSTLETGASCRQSALRERRRDVDMEETYDWQIERVALPSGEHGVVCYFYDLSAQKRAERALEERLAEIEALYHNAPIGLALLDRDLRFLRINEALAEMNGVPSAAHLGHVVWDIVPSLRQAVEPKLREVLETGLFVEGEIAGETPKMPGVGRWWHEKYYPLKGADGAVIAIGATVEEITARKEAEAALIESEARFRSTFENAAVGIAHVAIDGRFLEVNARLCQIVGYSREELQARSKHDLTHPDDAALSLEEERRLLAGEISSYTVDKRYVRKDGSLVWVGVTAALRRDPEGEPRYIIAIIRDITQRKEAQSHQAFLLRELAHRMKNQLAVIQAMAGQTVRGSDSLEHFHQQFLQRLQGLAVGTDLLLAEGWTGVRLDELVRRQLGPFHPGPGRLEAGGPDVSISPEATHAIGLALHELAANCVKHGAWSAAAGVVTVGWEVDGPEGPGGSLRLSWVERGGPPVEPPARNGFGHVVIERMVAQKVGGRAQLVFAPEGLSWSLTVPPAHFGTAFAGRGGSGLPVRPPA